MKSENIMGRPLEAGDVTSAAKLLKVTEAHIRAVIAVEASGSGFLGKYENDPRLPKKMRSLVLAAIAYFILPVDIIPEDLEGPYGYVDDIWLCAFVADRIRKEMGNDEILVNNWDGEGKIIPLIGEILSEWQSLIGDKKSLILDYIGFDF